MAAIQTDRGLHGGKRRITERGTLKTASNRSRSSRTCPLKIDAGSNLGPHPDVLERLHRLRVISCEPFVFFDEIGFALVGVIPDATSVGRHDIIMAKRVPPHINDG